MKRFAIVFFCIIISTYSTIAVFAGTWEQDAKGYKYKLENECGDDLNGLYIGYGAREIDDGVYFFDKGYMQTNCWKPTENGNWIYLGPDGKMLKDCVSPDGYAINRTGAAADSEGKSIVDQVAINKRREELIASGGQFVDRIDIYTEPSGVSNAGNWEEGAIGTRWKNSDGTYLSSIYARVRNPYIKSKYLVFYFDSNGYCLINGITPDGLKTNDLGMIMANDGNHVLYGYNLGCNIIPYRIATKNQETTQAKTTQRKNTQSSKTNQTSITSETKETSESKKTNKHKAME